ACGVAARAGYVTYIVPGRAGSSDQHFPTFEEFYGANPSHARARNERGRCRAYNRGCRQRHAGRPRRASIDRPKERPHAGCRVGEHARALAADRRTARNRFRGGTHYRQGSRTDPGTLMQFDRLDPAELVSLLLAAIAGGSLYAIVVTSPPLPQGKHITVLAAASMQNALDDINAAFTKGTDVKVIAGYAASSALIKQIAQGAAADVFASANLEWMDFGSRRKLIKGDTRVNLLGNQLVLIAPNDSKLASVVIGPNLDLAKLAGGGSIAVGDVRQVPVGKYAKVALEKLGAWQAAAPKLATAINTRVALTMVARGEAPLGIVYTTDANGARYCGDRRPRCVENLDVLRSGPSAAAEVSPSVKIIGTFPADSHPAIVYPVAATVTAKPEAVDYLAYLRSMTAKAIFEQYGFTFLLEPAS